MRRVNRQDAKSAKVRQENGGRENRSPYLFVAALMFGCVLLVGCGGAEKVSKRAYDHAQSVYSLSNRQSESQIDVLAEAIDADVAGGTLTDREAGLLRAMLDDARGEDWKAAASAAREMMTDQVER